MENFIVFIWTKYPQNNNNFPHQILLSGLPFSLMKLMFLGFEDLSSGTPQTSGQKRMSLFCFYFLINTFEKVVTQGFGFY